MEQHCDLPIPAPTCQPQHIATRIGVLGDMQGSGKSLVILALLAFGPPVDKRALGHSFHGRVALYDVGRGQDCHMYRAHAHTTLLVTTPPLLEQWKMCASEHAPVGVEYRCDQLT